MRPGSLFSDPESGPLGSCWKAGGVLKLVFNSGIGADMLDLEVECQHLKRDFSTFVLNYKQVSVTQEGLKIDSDGTGVEAK